MISDSFSPLGKRVGRNLREDLRGTQNKHKKSKIGNGDAIDESLVRLVRRKLSEGSLFKVVIGD